jgi:uncharacterized surface protein with fasciclin (FAS1) repeats
MTKVIRHSGSIIIMAFCSVLVFSSCQKQDLQAPQVTADATTGQGKSPSSQKSDMTIGEIAAGNGNFTQLVDALDYTGLLNLFLTGKDQFTVFAPTDAAFETLYGALGISSIRDLDVNLVTNVLLYHVTEGRRFSNSVLPKNNIRGIETLLNKPFYVNSTGGIDTNDGDTNINATISTPDISAKNGVIHVINSVLIPE